MVHTVPAPLNVPKQPSAVVIVHDPAAAQHAPFCGAQGSGEHVVPAPLNVVKDAAWQPDATVTKHAP